MAPTARFTVSGGTRHSRERCRQPSSQPYRAELNMLVTALDEFHAGRVVEVGDILSSRIRMLTAALEQGGSKGAFKLARHFLVYHTQDLSLCSNAMYDEALKIEARAAKREKELHAAGVDR